MNNIPLNGTTRKAIIGEMPVVDFLYLCYLFSVVLMSTLGYSASDTIYVVVAAVGCLFAIMRVLALRYEPRYFAAVLFLTCISIIELAVSRRFTLVLTVLLLVSARGIDLKRILFVFFAAKIVGLVLLVVFATTGIFDVEYYQYYKMASDSYVQRMRINGSGTTILHLSVISCFALWFYLRDGRVSPLFYVLGIVVNVFTYGMVHSTMGLLMGAGSLLLFLFCQALSRSRHILISAAKWIIPVLLLFSFGTAVLYGGNELVNRLDALFQGRIYYNHFFLTNYQVSLFGHGMLTSEGNFDNSFVFIFVAYGLVTFSIIFCSMQTVLCRLAADGAWVSIAFAAVFLLVGLSESFYPSAAVNPSLFLLLTLLNEKATEDAVMVTKEIVVRGKHGIFN